LVNVIAAIIIFEEADFIEATINSLLFFCGKVIVCEGAHKSARTEENNGHSTDGTWEIVKKMAEQDDRIDLFHYSGLSQADHRNIAYKHAMKYDADWILLGDGDEIFPDNAGEAIEAHIKKDERLAYCFSWRLYWNDLYHYEEANSPARLFKIVDNKARICDRHCMLTPPGKDYILKPIEGMILHHPSYARSEERFRVKFNHRQIDDNSHFPHYLYQGHIWRGNCVSMKDWAKNLNRGKKKDLPSFLQNHPACEKRWNNLWQYRWPETKPDVKESKHGWLADGTARMLRSVLNDKVKSVLELGSWVGKSTRFILHNAPNCVVYSVDHWKGSEEQQESAKPEVKALLPVLYETFLVNLWKQRRRVVPIRASTIEGMEQIFACRINPDVIYVDAAHDYENVKADIECARRLFDKAVIVGDDYAHPEVRRAVDEYAAANGLKVKSDGYGWKYI